MAVDFNLPTVATSYTAFPTQIIENIDAALQQLSVGSPSNVPTNAIKWDASLNRWRKYNGSAYVDLTGTYNLNANVSVNQLDLGDSEKIRLGGSQDLEIFHDQTLGHSFIKDTGTGNLKICGSTVDLVNAGNTALLLKASQGSGGTTSLYQNGDERLKTLSTGVEIFGTSLDLGDNVSLNLGTNDDFKLKHNNTDGIIENTKGILYVKKSDGSGSSQDGIKMEANSKISLFHSTGVGSNPQFETTTNGILLRGQNLGSSLDDEVIVFDSNVSISNAGKVQIKHVRDDTTNTSWTTAATRLQMRVDNTDQGYIQFNGADNNYGMELGTNGLEKFAYFVRNGKAELYFDNVPKLATLSTGVDITGALKTTGSITIENTAPEISFNDTTGSPDYKIRKQSGHFMIMETGQTNDSEWRFSIRSGGTINIPGNLDVGSGIDVTGHLRIPNDTGILKLGASDDLQIFHNATNSVIANTGGNLSLQTADNNINLWNSTDQNYLAQFNGSGSVQLYYDGSKKFETTSWGSQISGTLKTSGGGVSILSDGEKFTAGAGDDLQIYHNGSTSYITDNGTGSLVINSVDGNIHLRVNNNEEGVKVNENGAVQLFYNGSPKFETKSWGAEVDSNSFTTLSVRSTDNDAVLQLVANNDDTTEWTIRNDYSDNNDLDFRFNNNRKLTLDSSGNLTANSFTGDGSALTGINSPPQCVSTQLTSTFTNSDNPTPREQFQTVLSLSITPSSSSVKLLIMITGHINANDGESASDRSNCIFRCFEDSTEIGVEITKTTGGDRSEIDQNILRTPNSTATKTYHLKIRSHDNDENVTMSAGATLTILEVS